MKLLLHLALMLVGVVLVSRAEFDDEFDPDMMMDDYDGGVETMDDEDLDMMDGDAGDSEPEPVVIPREERPVYKTPKVSGNIYLLETFESTSLVDKKWIRSQAKKDGTEDTIAKYDGVWEIQEPNDPPLQNDLALVLKSRARHHAISAKLDKPFKFDGKPLVVQYEVNLQNGQECGGAYVKLLSQESKLDLSKFVDKTGYTIMFGPDKCGNDDKLHFIFRHKNPKTKEFEEKHAKKPTASFSSYFTDKKTHLYTLIVSPDNSFEVYIDQSLINSGNLLEDMSPPVNPPKEVVDENDKKPDDWDERERIPDPDSVKPEDWDEDAPEEIEDEGAVKPDGWLDDEPELVPNPEVEKPADWDDEMDGEFEAPLIDNPKCKDAPGCGEWKRPVIKNPLYKGRWSAPMIDNPDYKGIWEPRKIANPDYFEDKEPYKMTPIQALGLELWSMSDDILFDNFIITDDKAVADSLASQTWAIKRTQELAGYSGKSVVDSVLDLTNERPWLWVLIGLVVLIPIVLIFNYCCSSSSQSTPSSAQRKKTDEPTPDAPATPRKSGGKSSVPESSGDEEGGEAEEDEIEEEQEEVEKAGGDQTSSTKVSPRKAAGKKPSKSDLEADEDEKREVAAGDQEEVDRVHFGTVKVDGHFADFDDSEAEAESLMADEEEYEPEFSPLPSSRDVTKTPYLGN